MPRLAPVIKTVPFESTAQVLTGKELTAHKTKTETNFEMLFMNTNPAALIDRSSRIYQTKWKLSFRVM